MAHAIWTGSINFGLVTIPVKLFSAIRSRAEIHFNLLHDKDKGRIHNERVCEHGHKVAWNDIVKGYQYEKGQYVIITDEDFKKVNPEATQSVDIIEFVDQKEINPMFYDTPYFLEPEKKGRHAYALLREALKKSGKVGIARVVIRTREHLAALRPYDEALVLEIMHYDDELVPAGNFDLPPSREKTPENEMKAALMLIDTMVDKFDPAAFRDKYKDELMAMIEARAQGKSLPKGKAKPRPATNVVNLVDVLQRSLNERRAQRPAVRKTSRKKVAVAS